MRIDIQKIVQKDIDLSDAILCEIEEYKNLNDVHIVKYLMGLWHVLMYLLLYMLLWKVKLL